MTTNLSGCVIIKDGKLLLILKKKHKHYELPGGMVKPGESLEHAAIRETKEEIGCDVDIIKYLGYSDFRIDSKEFRSHKFLSSIKKGQKPRIKEPEIFSEMIWLPIKDYKKYPIAPNVVDICEDYLSGKLDD